MGEWLRRVAWQRAFIEQAELDVGSGRVSVRAVKGRGSLKVYVVFISQIYDF